MKTIGILLTIALLAAGAARASEPGDTIWQGILANPPTIPHTEARNDALRALDEWLSQPDSERSEEVIAYYQRALDRALDTLETERISKGVRLFQFYSSSVIVQTPETVFAIDLDQGANRGMTRTAADEGVGFTMTREQIARTARLVDFSFHTHEHDDHVDFEMTQALIEAGKTVIVTKSNKQQWADQPWAEKLVVLDQTIAEPHAVGPLKVDVLWDHQWGDEEHTRGTPCNAYLITMPDGTSVFSKGDINCGLRLYGWLKLMVDNGRRVDLAVGSPLYWRGVNLTYEIDALLTPVWAIGHVWEFTHRSPGKAGGATGTYTGNLLMMQGQMRHGTPIVLSWGEYLDFSPGASQRSRPTGRSRSR